MTQDVFVGRQPICKGKAEVFGYELLCQHDDLTRACKGEDHAAAAALVKTSIEMGLEKLAGPNLAFVGITPDFLRSGLCSSLPKSRVVLEISPAAASDPASVESMAKLSDQGYKIALDN